ncbi:MAG: hypothetical protein ACLVKO_08160 [Dysgonomonas sp.]
MKLPVTILLCSIFIFKTYANDSLKINVDSIFRTHINSIEKELIAFGLEKDTTRFIPSGDDLDFLMTVDNIANFDLKQQEILCPIPMINWFDLCNIKKWYHDNKDNLNYSKFLRVFFLERKLRKMDETLNMDIEAFLILY